MHTPTINRGTHEFNKDDIRYACSCGASGSACKTQAEALIAFQGHVGRANEEERAERIRAAAPKLLEALEFYEMESGHFDYCDSPGLPSDKCSTSCKLSREAIDEARGE